MEPIFTPEQLAQVHAYVHPYYVWAALRDVVGLGIYLLVLRFGVRPLFGAASGLAAWSGRRLAAVREVPVLRALPAALDRLWGGAGWGATLLFSALYVGVIELVYLPRDLYLDYFHQHAFGLSNYTPLSYAVDELKSFALQVLASAFVAFGLYGLARRLRGWWLALGVVAGGVMLFSSALDPWRGQLFFEQAPLAQGELRNRITALMSQAGIEFRDVVVEKTSRASKTVNAYFAGQGPTRTIVLNDTLVKQFEQDEILAVVAHEAGHVREPRWPRRVLAALALLMFLFLADRLLRVSARRGWFGATGFADIRTLPLIGFSLWLLLSVGQPFSAADSRRKEAEADAYALRLTRNPAAFRSMLVKAARINKSDPEPPRWVELRSLGHPSMRSRLQAVAAYGERTIGE